MNISIALTQEFLEECRELDDLFVKPCTFAELIERVYQHKFDGRIILHCNNGVPCVAEFIYPRQLMLDRRKDVKQTTR